MTPARNTLQRSPTKSRNHAAKVLFTPHHQIQSSLTPGPIFMAEEAGSDAKQSALSEIASQIQHLSLASETSSPEPEPEKTKGRKGRARDVWDFFDKRKVEGRRGRGKGKHVGDEEETESVCKLCL